MSLIKIHKMKRRNFISPVILLSGLLFVIFLISCGKKDDPQGPPGPVGPSGPEGPKGDAGSSDVIYSEWLDVGFTPDTIRTVGGDIDTLGFYAIIDAPKLTAALLSKADVKVYINVNDESDPVIYPLPYNGKSGIYIEVSAYTKTIQLESNSDVSTTISNNGIKFQQYRYMIVSGNILARSEATVNWSDYASVKAYLRLKD